MRENSFKGKFEGKEFWRTLNMILFFGIYALFFIVPIFFPDQIWVVLGIAAFLMMIYVTVQQFFYRKMERKNAGRRVLYGWIERNESTGEEWEIPIEKVNEQNKTSHIEREEIDKYLKRYEEEISKPKIGGFKEYQLPYIRKEKRVDENVK